MASIAATAAVVDDDVTMSTNLDTETPSSDNKDKEEGADKMEEEGEEEEEDEEEEGEGDNEEEDEEQEDAAAKDKQDNPFEYLAEPPNSMKGLVACRACALVKTFDQFYENDCDNCDIMGQEDRATRIRITTTPHFDGLCGIYQPEQSWAARWQGFNSLKPGLYALKVLEELPADIKAELDQTKTPYLKEDTATRQEEDMLGGAD